jgi:hypothetical protein
MFICLCFIFQFDKMARIKVIGLRPCKFALIRLDNVTE